MQPPRLCDPVHYVSFGTPGGEYPSVCRAAIVTGVGDLIGTHATIPHDSDEQALSLCVLNPEGFFFNRGVIYHDGAGDPGNPECLSRVNHGNPFRYCACGWTEPQFKGGTWHFAEHNQPGPAPESSPAMESACRDALESFGMILYRRSSGYSVAFAQSPDEIKFVFTTIDQVSDFTDARSKASA